MTRPQDFKSGNKHGKGRPSGSRNKFTNLCEMLGSEKVEEFHHKMFDLAIEGNTAAIKYVGDRVYPAPKHSPKINIPTLNRIETQKDVDKAMTVVLECMTSGDNQLTIDEAGGLIKALMTKRETIESAVSEELREIMKQEGLKYV